MAIDILQKGESLSKSIIDQVISIDQEVMDFPWQVEQWRQLLKQDLDWMLAVERDGELVKGFALFQLSGDNWSHLLKIGVLNRFKRLGIARLILKESLIKLALTYENCSLEVREANLSAIKLYEGHRFKLSHVINSYYSDGSSAVKMIVELR